MTDQEKNIEIAKMLGWVYKNVIADDYDARDSFYPVFKKTKSWITPSGDQHETLNFHSDANWQYEAIEFIENIKLKEDKLYYFQMNRCYASVHSIENTIDKYRNNTDKGWEYFCNINASSEDKRKAVFEALFQFSQYLKQKK